MKTVGCDFQPRVSSFSSLFWSYRRPFVVNNVLQFLFVRVQNRPKVDSFILLSDNRCLRPGSPTRLVPDLGMGQVGILVSGPVGISAPVKYITVIYEKSRCWYTHFNSTYVRRCNFTIPRASNALDPAPNVPRYPFGSLQHITGPSYSACLHNTGFFA